MATDSIKAAPNRFAASRRSQVAPFLAMDVLSAATARERAGDSVVHMEIGEPGARSVDKIEYDRLRQQSIASPA